MLDCDCDGFRADPSSLPPGSRRPQDHGNVRQSSMHASCEPSASSSSSRLALAAPARADEAALRAIVAKFATAKGFRRSRRSCASSARPAIRPSRRPLTALSEGNLSFRKSDAPGLHRARRRAQSVEPARPVTGEPAGEAAKAELTKIKVNNGAAPRHPRRARHADARLRPIRPCGSPRPKTCSAIPIRRRSPRSTRRSPRRPMPASRRGSSRRAPRPCWSPILPRPTSSRRST